MADDTHAKVVKELTQVINLQAEALDEKKTALEELQATVESLQEWREGVEAVWPLIVGGD